MSDGVGEVMDWQASFTEYLAYRDEEQLAAQRQQREAEQRQRRQLQEEPPGEGTSAAAAAPPGPSPTSAGPTKKPLSNFEQRELARLEESMEALTANQAELQAKVDAFDPGRSGYTELNEWTEEIDAIGEELAEVELKWLALAERAE